MRQLPFAFAVAGLLLSSGLVTGGVQAGQDKPDKERPKLSLRSTPALSFSPARVSFTAELRGGPDDYEEFYCPTIEWDWDDGTVSESRQDCDPYVAGTSKIKRLYTATHEFELSGRYNVNLRLKRQSKVLIAASVKVEVKPGPREGIGQ